MLDLKYVMANVDAVRQNCVNRNVPDDVLEDIDRVVDAGGRAQAAAPGRRGRSGAGRTRWPRRPARRRTPSDATS